ncbi:HPr-rel-A system PqqD family peptide chaperone [Thiobacillus sp.]|uniref:HPr-rel-A system PqqD family peptide chaperone n=1 Tax=Thiobacillus sp. TaxID=924 RepID=UPI00286E8DA0|nr:HPr-rel-A system PqqD family peptide chaperone [Thiobacillus sp.]
MARFRIKSFGDEAVVFDTASGDTHFLAPFTLALFQLVQNNPGLSVHELEAVLMSEIELPGSTHLSALTQESLASLRQLGLLEIP